MHDKQLLALALVSGLSVCAAPPVGAAEPGTATNATAVSTQTTGAQPPAGVRKGSFLVSPELGVGESYDDNVYATRDNEKSDTVTVVSPSLNVSSLWKKHAVRLNLGADIGRYAQYTSENYTDLHANTSGRYDFSKDMNIFGGVGYSRNHEERTSPDNVDGTEPTIYSDTHGHLGLSRQLGRISLRAGGTASRLRFDDVPAASGGIINNADRNRTVYGLGGRVGYNLDKGKQVFIQGTYDKRTYEQATDDYGYQRSSHGYGAALGFEITVPGRVRGELLAGYREQRYADPTLPDVTVPDFGADLTWSLSPSTSLKTFVQRTIEETIQPGASSYVSTAGGIRLTQQLKPRLSVSARASYEEDSFHGIARTDKVVDAGLGASYRLGRYLYLDTDYTLLQRTSDLATADYYRNLLYVGLRALALPPLPKLTASAGEPTAHGNWSGFYAVVGTGYGMMDTETASARGSHGYDNGDFGAGGSVSSLSAGYGWTLGRALYLGAELQAETGDSGWNHVKTPSSRIFSAYRNDGYGVSARLGYVADNASLLYGRAGVVRTRFHNTYSETGSSFSYDNQTSTGTRYGVGTDVPLGEHAFWRTDYTYTDYGNYPVNYSGGSDTFSGNSGAFQIGLGWRLNRAKPAPAVPASDLDGFYAGVQAGDSRAHSSLDAIQHQSGPPTETRFQADFGGRGTAAGIFGGYGHTLGRFYLGVELDAQDSKASWYHVKDPGGRDFSAETKGGYGGGIRVGYVVPNGSLIYLSAGRVWTKFNTQYVKGNNASAWVDRDDTLVGNRLGVGTEVPLSKATFVRFDYAYTTYEGLGFTTTQAQPDTVDLKNSEASFKVGLGVRF